MEGQCDQRSQIECNRAAASAANHESVDGLWGARAQPSRKRLCFFVPFFQDTQDVPMFFSRQPADDRSAAALPPSREGYVELGRRFALLSKTGDRDNAADESYLVRVWS